MCVYIYIFILLTFLHSEQEWEAVAGGENALLF